MERNYLQLFNYVTHCVADNIFLIQITHLGEKYFKMIEIFHTGDPNQITQLIIRRAGWNEGRSMDTDSRTGRLCADNPTNLLDRSVRIVIH